MITPDKLRNIAEKVNKKEKEKEFSKMLDIIKIAAQRGLKSQIVKPIHNKPEMFANEFLKLGFKVDLDKYGIINVDWS